MTNRPPWEACSGPPEKRQREIRAFDLWAHSKLDDLQEDMLRSACKNADYANFAADVFGDMRMLRQQNPTLARHLNRNPNHIYKPWRKRRPSKHDLRDNVGWAVWAVKELRKIWKSEYEFVQRTAHHGSTTEEIALSWLAKDDVTIEDILRRMNKSGPSGKKRE